jgi:hypothetical protein
MTNLDLFKRGARKVTQALVRPLKVLFAALAENRIHRAAQACITNASKTHGAGIGRAR